MLSYLDFEKDLAEIGGKIALLRDMHVSNNQMDISDDIIRLEDKAALHLKELYSKLTPWQKCQVARHPSRPHAFDYIKQLFTDFIPMAGDRNFGEDLALVSGMARLKGAPVMVLGQEKGHDTQSRVRHNFGMAKPEGYRKAIRLMELADRFRLPVITFIDTPGAFPGKEAEERGQAEAIARSTEKCLELGVPIISVIVGEGGSGGAIALAAANRIIMLEHSVYSVISPEGCAAILWKSADKAKDAAAALRLTSQDLLKLGVIDRIVTEPLGGAQRAPHETIALVGDAIADALRLFAMMKPQDIRLDRRNKFLAMGKKKLG